jgi:uncharacterized tellurite resistance protein B-like protein
MSQPASAAGNPELTLYPDNSAEAMLRVIALFVVSDGELADQEMDTLETLGVLQTLGVDRERFALVFDAYCDDLIAHAGTARYVAVADPDWVDAVLAPITDSDRRKYLASILLLVARADGYFADAELSVYRRLLDRWGLDIEQLGAEADPASEGPESR